MPKQFPMVFQTGLPLGIVRRITDEQAILGNDAAIDFAIPELASKFIFLGWRFAPLNNRGMRLKQADDLFRCGHRLVLEDSPGRLLNHLTHQGHILRQEFRERQRTFAATLPKPGLDCLDLSQHRFHELDELAIEVFAQFFSFF